MSRLTILSCARCDDYPTFLIDLTSLLHKMASRLADRCWSARIETDDLVQEALLVLWQKRDLVQQAPEPLPYAVTAARRAMYAYLRDELHPSSEVRLDVPLRGQDGKPRFRQIASPVSEQQQDSGARRTILRLTRSLSADRRRALFLSYHVDAPGGRPYERSDWLRGNAALYRSKYEAIQTVRRICGLPAK